MPPRSTRVLTESRVRQIIAAILRKETRKAFSSNLTDLLNVNTPIVIDNPGGPSAAVGFDLTVLSSSTPVAADELMIYDIDLATERKITITDLNTLLTPLIDHGTLAGLTDDDHSAYILAPGAIADNAMLAFGSTSGRVVESRDIFLTDTSTDVIFTGGAEKSFRMFAGAASASSEQGKDIRLAGSSAYALAAGSEIGGSIRLTVGSGINGGADGKIYLIGEIVLDNTNDTGFVSGGSGTVVEIHADGTQIADFTATNLSMAGTIDMNGNDIVGYSPKESHIDFISLAAEHAFS